MPIRVSGEVKISGQYQEVLYPSHIKSVVGLLISNKIDPSILPLADASNHGVVKLSGAYNPTVPGFDVALSQSGAKELFSALMLKISNLESPLDYVTSMSVNWTTSTTQSSINTAFSQKIIGDLGFDMLLQGMTVLVNNSGNYTVTWNGVSNVTTGYWLWIYDGINWNPSVEFPEVPAASLDGVNESAMIEGIITKAMLWKLKNIEPGAQVNTVTKVANKTGDVSLEKGDVGLGNVDNTADVNKEVLTATKLKTARTIAGVNFDGSANINIPFANLSSKPTTISGYGITDAQPKDNDLSAIAALVGTSGFLKKTATDTWELDLYADMKLYASLPPVAEVPENRVVLVIQEVI